MKQESECIVNICGEAVFMHRWQPRKRHSLLRARNCQTVQAFIREGPKITGSNMMCNGKKVIGVGVGVGERPWRTLSYGG